MNCRMFSVLVSLLFFTLPASLRAQAVFTEGAPTLVVEEKKGADEVSLPRFSRMAKQLSPSVVNISVEGGSEEEQPQIEGKKDEKESHNPFRSLGSGFIISEEGYIVTSNHVIDKSDSVLVRLLDDKTEYKAKIVGQDRKTDLALLKIEPKSKLTVAFLGDSDSVEVGEWVLAIGNQFELGQTVTAGIVSAKSRRVPSKNMGPYDNFIQTDASINPGSSGGPLFNTRGQVIGVNTAIFTPNRGQFGGPGFNIGIGFSIPVNLVKQVVSQLKSTGKVIRGLLGVLIQKIDNDLAEALALPSTDGALVAEVVKDSPAGRAGFEPKDIVISFDGKPIKEYEDLPLFVANAAVGSTVKVEVLRSGQKKVFDVKIEELKEDQKAKEREKKTEKPDRVGLVVEAVSEEVARVLKLASMDGVLVSSVESNSSGEKAGVSPGDVILEIKGVKITSVDGYAQAIKALEKNKPTPIFVRKRDGNRYLALKAKGD